MSKNLFWVCVVLWMGVATFTKGGGTLALGSIYQLNPVKSGLSGYGTASSPVGLLAQCQGISPNDTIIVSSGENFFKDLTDGFYGFSGSLQENRIKIHFTGGTSQLENLNTVMNQNNSTTYYPYVDLVISGEETTVSAKRMFNFNQGSSITVQDGGTLTIQTDNASMIYGSKLTVDGENLNMKKLGIGTNSQTLDGDRLVFNVAHESKIQIDESWFLERQT